MSNKQKWAKIGERGALMKILLPVIAGAAAGLVLYVLHAPSFLILIAAVGAALIASAKLW